MLSIKNKVVEVQSATQALLDDEFLRSTKPVVLRGLLNDWKLVTRGLDSDQRAIDYLMGFYTHKLVHAMVLPASYRGRYFYNESMDGFNFQRRTESLNDIFSKLLMMKSEDEPQGYYVGSTSVDQVFPGLRNENDITSLSNKPLINFWIGNRSRVAAHYDVTDNLACNVMGKRRFILFPPSQVNNLYIGPLDFTPAGQSASMVDFSDVDYKKYPNFKEAEKSALVAELEPGDAIFIPSMWWHHVEGLSPINFMINYWWRQAEPYMGAPMDALNHALLSIKDLPEEQRDVWRMLFDFYVFSNQEHSHIPEEILGVLGELDEAKARRLRALLLRKLNR